MIELQNADRLMVKLDNLADIDLTNFLQRACLVVESEAKVNCPVDSGELRASITHEVSGKTGVVGTNKEYAPYVEFGTGLFASEGNGRQTPWSYQDAAGEWHTTVGQKPQPFLYPALNSKKMEINQMLHEEIDKEVRRNAGL